MEKVIKALQLAKDSTYAGIMPEPAKEHLRKQLDEAMQEVKNISSNAVLSSRFQKVLEEELIWLNNMEIDIAEIEGYDIDSETRSWLKTKIQDRKIYMRTLFENGR